MKRYDTASQISVNERPVIVILGEEFEVDNRKQTLTKLFKELKKKDLSELDIFDIYIKIALGESAAKKIDEMDINVSNLMDILIYIQAAIFGITYEEAKERFRL